MARMNRLCRILKGRRELKLIALEAPDEKTYKHCDATSATAKL